ncbi:hypothetical protein DFJ73DRAFT_792445 [Zopfochytrium polystomum]|nr:hypothetical protein DFJ73DRAFT_792445 [Zopfochytrium polystomum]
MRRSGTELERPEKMLSRAGVRWFMTQVFFHNTIIGLVILDLVLVFADIILSINTACIPTHDPLNPTAPYHCRPTIEPSKALSTGKQAINTTSIALLVIFSIEILFSITIHIVDAVAVFASLGLEFYSQYGGVIIVLRIWKMFRIIHAISHALDLHNRTLVRRMKRTNIAILRASSTLHADLIAERDRLAAMAKRVAAAGTETAAGGMDAVVYDLREAQKRLSRAVRRAETTLGAELNEEDMVAYGLMEPPAEKPPARGLTLKRGKGRS